MKFYYISFLCLILTGCSTVITHTVRLQPVMPNLPSKVVLKPVTWQVVSLNGTNAIFGLDSKNYENLSRNLSDITAYIEKLRYTIHSIETTNFTYTTNTINSNTNRWFKSLFN